MNLIKKVIIFIVCLVIITIAVIFAIKYIQNAKIKHALAEQQEKYLNVMENPGRLINGLVPEELKNVNWYFTVKNCLNKYIKYVNENNSEVVYSLLDKEYIKSNKLTQKNVIEFVRKEDLTGYYRIENIHHITGLKYATYYVKANFNNNQLFFIVNIDDDSKAFSIIPIGKEEYQKYISTPVNHEQSKEDTVEKNSYNNVMYNYDKEKEIVERYLQDYLEAALFNTNMAYDLLDIEYKKAKFNNVDEYKKYIEARREMLEKMCKKTWKSYDDFSDYNEYEKYFQEISMNRLDKYSVKNDNGNKQYICIDTFGNYYIFNMESIMKYSIMLDNYTIASPEFSEKYYNAEEPEKVALNIQKVFDALNNKDYNYVYGKLADGFKNKYFNTLETFEAYAKENFYDENEVEYLGFTKESEEYYSYSLKVTDSKTNNAKALKIIMELGEGTDFKMSFNV